ncbi:MAG: nucleotidyltransferase family protein [Phycisphaerae bacterium]
MTPANGAIRVWGIIPAAGLGRRMGLPKQTLRYRDSTIGGSVMRTLLDAGLDGVVVVTRTDLVDALDLPNDPKVEIAVNDDAHSEMIDSIRIGLARLVGEGVGDIQSTECARASDDPAPTAAPPHSLFAIRPLPFKTDGVLVVPADMPALTAQTCRTCVAAFITDPKRIVIATHEGKRGHPIIFPLALREAINNLEGGLRVLPRIHADRVFLVEVVDPGAFHDIDTPEDFEQA